MAAPWLSVYLRQGKYYVPCTSLVDEGGLQQEVAPVSTAPAGDELALAEALEWAFERSGRRKQDIRLSAEFH